MAVIGLAVADDRLIAPDIPVCRSWSNQHSNHRSVAIPMQTQTVGGCKYMCSMLCSCSPHVLQWGCLPLHPPGLEHCFLGHPHHWVCWSCSCWLGLWYVSSMVLLTCPMGSLTELCVCVLNVILKHRIVCKSRVYAYFRLNLSIFRHIHKTVRLKCLFHHVCLSVHPSVWKNSALTGRIFMKFGVCIFFENLSKKFKCH